MQARSLSAGGACGEECRARKGNIPMVTISVCMIVKNEERILARCLDSLKRLADEIIIVDTGSVDDTKRIAGAYTDKV